MNLIELPVGWTVALNCLGIPAVHLGVSWACLRMPAAWFVPSAPVFRPRAWERGGRFYEVVFGVRRWGRRLPDAAPWFGGTAVRNLSTRDPTRLRALLVETCRGEFAHWLQVLLIGLFVVWNPPPAAAVIVAYALASNVPCIVNLRYVRARLARVIRSREGGSRALGGRAG